MTMNLQKLSAAAATLRDIIVRGELVKVATVQADGFERLIAFDGNGRKWKWITKSFQKV